jgi:colicin import membrane protein
LSEHRLPEPRIRDEFRRELRARLMREAAVVLVPKRRETAWTAWLRPALAVGLATLVLAFGAGSAAAGSVPGDVTFGLKRAIEEVRVALTFDDVERVRVLAEIADQRLTELERVASRDDKAPTASEAYADAVARFRAAVDALQEAAPEDKRELAQDVADAARDKHEFLLERLKERLSEKAKDSVDRAIEEERKDTPNTKDKKLRDKKDRDGEDENGEAPSLRSNTPSPRGSERTSSPRPSERTTSPRATSSPRPTERD